MDETGLENSAILLLSLGEEDAAEVFKYLGPKEVQRIGAAMSRLKGVTRDRIDAVLSTFREEAGGLTSIGTASDEYIRNVLTKALGNEKAGLLLDRILTSGDAAGIESLRWMDPSAVAELIRNEHPQIVASILVHLERDHASDILAQLNERTRNDVLLRIAMLEGIQPGALRELNDVLAKVLAGTDSVKKAPLGGIRTAAEILNFTPTAVETEMMNAIREYDAELAQKIMDEMFVFENLLDVDDRGIQALLREVQSESLIVALKGASAELRDKILANMSQRAAELLKDDLEAKGPVRVSQVESEQKEILKIVRRLAEEGQIVLGGKGEEAYV